MKQIFAVLLLALMLSALSGCIVRTRNHHHHHGNGRSRACPPSYHWNGSQCVHNGRGRGRGNGPTVRDHRH